jgi:hypothetical protein
VGDGVSLGLVEPVEDASAGVHAGTISSAIRAGVVRS